MLDNLEEKFKKFKISNIFNAPIDFNEIQYKRSLTNMIAQISRKLESYHEHLSKNSKSH